MPAEVQESYHALALRPGVILSDRYRIVRPIRVASPFSFSYQAEDETDGNFIVIKEFFPRSLVSRGTDGVSARPHSPDCERDYLRALHRFALEGAVLAESSHPNLVRVRAVVDANATVYLIMDRHESQSLAEFVESSQSRMAPAEAAKLVQQLLTALETLHTESVIHRDLSPRTVHVTANRSALVLEFSARRHLPVHATDLAPGFAAFEQYGTKDIGPWTDVYAVSALFYYLLTGTTPPSALERAAGEAAISPLMAVPGLAPGIAALVTRGMALLPQQRPHAISELRRLLESTLVEGRATPARNVYSALTAEATPRTDEVSSSEYESGVPLRLAAGGIVVPGEERGSTKWLRMLRSATTRLRGGAKTSAAHNESEDIEAQLAPAAQMPVPRPVLEEEQPSRFVPPPVAAALATTTAAPLVATPIASEPSVAVVPESARHFDLASEISLSTVDLDVALARSSRRQRYSLAAAAGLVIAVGGSLIVLARSGGASAIRGVQEAPAATPTRQAGAPAARTTVTAVRASVEDGAVLQNAPRDGAPTTRSEADSVASAAKRAVAPSHNAPAPSRGEPTVEQRPAVLPAGRLPNVRIALAGSAADLKIVPPELLVDAKTRLTNGEDQIEQGDYAIARRTFRTAIAQLDSVATRYPESQSIKGLRRELEQAESRALQACTAENDMRKRRGEEARACQ